MATVAMHGHTAGSTGRTTTPGTPRSSCTCSTTSGTPGVDHAAAEDLTAQTQAVCPYSNATRGNIPVELTVSEDG
jgi:organic hydroperoxide reductase OsmC/OhrA